MTPYLGNKKAEALQLYTPALYTPSKPDFHDIRRHYTPSQVVYLSKFEDLGFYRSYSNLDGLTTISQGAVCIMSAVIRNNILNVEPQQIFFTSIQKERPSFIKWKPEALSWNGTVPPHVERHLEKLMDRAKELYLPTIRWLDIHKMEATLEVLLANLSYAQCDLPLNVSVRLFVVSIQ